VIANVKISRPLCAVLEVASIFGLVQNPYSAVFSRKNPESNAWAGFTEAQQAYLTKAGLRPDTRGIWAKARDVWRKTLSLDDKIKWTDRLMQGGVDRYWGLKRAVARAEHITLETGPYQAARLMGTSKNIVFY